MKLKLGNLRIEDSFKLEPLIENLVPRFSTGDSNEEFDRLTKGDFVRRNLLVKQLQLNTFAIQVDLVGDLFGR